MRRAAAVLVGGAIAVAGAGRADADPPTVMATRILAKPAAVIVPVTINGHAAAMKLDTGADTTVVDARAAKAFGLVETGKVRKLGEAGCVSKSQPAAIASWTLGAVGLPPTTAAATTFKGKLGKVAGLPLVGLLGNDALTGFGTVNIDFTSGLITLGSGSPPDGLGVRTHRQTDIDTGLVSHFVADVAFAGAPHTIGMAVDTGAPTSTIERAAARRVGAPVVGRTTLRSPGCVTKTKRVRLAGWSMGPVSLARETVPVTHSVLARFGISGLVGADQLERYGAVTFDYLDGTVTVGPLNGPPATR